MSATICKHEATGTNKAIGKNKAIGNGKNKATTKASGGKWPAVADIMASSRGHNLH